MKNLKNSTMKFCKKNRGYIITTVIMVFAFAMPVYATGTNVFQQTKLYTGTMLAITFATATLTATVLGLTTFHTTKNVIAWQNAGEQDVAGCKKKFTRDLALGVLGTTIGGVITVFLALYQ